jgi:hypothetical protein
MSVHKWEHIGGNKESMPLSGNMRSNGSGEGLGGSENQSWNAQYRYMVSLSDKIDFISRHIFDAKQDLYYARKVLSELTGLWLLFLGSPKAGDMQDEKKRIIMMKLKTAEIYLSLGEVDKEVDLIKEIFVLILSALKDGYTFKGSRAKVRIRSGVAGDMDELVGTK